MDLADQPMLARVINTGNTKVTEQREQGGVSLGHPLAPPHLSEWSFNWQDHVTRGGSCCW